MSKSISTNQSLVENMNYIFKVYPFFQLIYKKTFAINFVVTRCESMALIYLRFWPLTSIHFLIKLYSNIDSICRWMVGAVFYYFTSNSEFQECFVFSFVPFLFVVEDRTSTLLALLFRREMWPHKGHREESSKLWTKEKKLELD